MATQTKTGKAFEYSLLLEFYNRLKNITTVSIVENSPYVTAKKCFDDFLAKDQDAYRLNSSSAVNYLLDIEPRLSNGLDNQDILQLELVADKEGQSGDVRDVLLIRSSQNWEIGISAKNNHKAVKHSRLSLKIDFGKKWLDIPCSQVYFDDIKPIFSMLESIRKNDGKRRWDSIENMHEVIYVPILNAFKNELMRLSKDNQQIVAEKLVEYLIGKKDFYKVIKGKNKVEIQAYNLYGTLNQKFEDINPKAKIPKLKLPTRLIDIDYENNSTTTLKVTLNEGWQISFRIHSAKSTIEPSLKFDINLISTPSTLFTNHIFV